MNVLLAVILILAAISALGVVFSSKTIYSALSLVLTVALLAAVFLVLNAQFLFVVQLIVYAGAVMVLFVFIIALLDPAAEDRPRIFDLRLILGVLAVAGLCTAVFIAARNDVTYDTSCTTQAVTCMHGYTVGSLAATGDLSADPFHTFGFNLAERDGVGVRELHLEIWNLATYAQAIDAEAGGEELVTRELAACGGITGLQPGRQVQEPTLGLKVVLAGQELAFQRILPAGQRLDNKGLASGAERLPTP